MYSDESDNRGLSSSIAYSSDEIAWCIATAKPVPQWQNLYRTGPAYLWVLLVSSGYFASVTLYILLKYETGPHQHHCFHIVSMSVLQTFFGLSTYFNPRNSCVRAYYSTVLFVGIVGTRSKLIVSMNSCLTDSNCVDRMKLYHFTIIIRNRFVLKLYVKWINRIINV